MAGRKRKPTALHVAQGTARPDRMNPDEPTPAADLPKPPKSLSKAEKRHFKTIVERLEELDYASSSHTELIVTLARRLAEVDELSAVIAFKGPTYTTLTRNGEMVRAQPEVAMRSEAQRHVQSLLAELGLTPTSSAKVTKRGKQKPAKAAYGLLERLK